MNPKKILVIPKISKVEWDMFRLGLNKNDIIKFYKKEGLNVENIFDSYYQQKASLKKILEILKNAKLVHRDDLSKDKVINMDLIIAFGGDNHFQYVSHFLDGIPILGINSDPKRSEGVLTSINTNNLEYYLPKMLDGSFDKEEWTRLRVSVNGKKINEQAISEIYIGEKSRFNMSRHILKVNGKYEEQKGSGLIIATGSGSKGWYNSASRYLFQGKSEFPKTNNEARFLLTEPYNGKILNYNLSNGAIKKGQDIEITSLSDSQAFLSIDSLKLIKLREGVKIKVSIGKSLQVIKPKKT